MADERVREVQTWLNTTYGNVTNWVQIDEDGITGGGTIKALIRALQYELNLTIDGIFGTGTKVAFDNRFPQGLSESTTTNSSTEKIIYILQGGFWCRGIDPDTFNGFFGIQLTEAVGEMQSQIGLDTINGIVDGMIMEAILTTDAFTLVSGGDSNIRIIQQSLNKNYATTIGSYIPTNGIYERKTNEGLIKAIQYRIGVDADGWWGEGTMSHLPTLSRGSSNSNLVYLLQYALYANGYNPNGFDGQFGGGAERAVKQCQSDYLLGVDGICGRQTWSALLVSCGDITRSVNACDLSDEVTTELANKLYQDGYRVIGRYITGNAKRIQPGELERIFQAGLKVFPIYQANDRNIEDFTFEKGRIAGNYADENAEQLGIPKGSIIYFAVDLDVYDFQISQSIIPYFKGIMNGMNGTYRIGVYGSRNVCIQLSNKLLVDSCFVADASYKFSGNAGYKLPSKWQYDQICEIKNYYNGIDIDKVVYKGTIDAIDRIETNFTNRNGNLTQSLFKLYSLASEYAPDDASILEKNKLVLQYLRYYYYNSKAWNAVDGGIDEDFIKYVINSESYNTLLHPHNIHIYIKEKDIYIGMPHVAATISAELNFLNQLIRADIDVAGWAGDLLQLEGVMQEKYDSNPEKYDYTIEEIMKLIGADTSEVINLGFIDARETGFSLEDLYQDVDARNMSEYLRTNTIFQVFNNYYDTSYSGKRFNKFIETLIGDFSNMSSEEAKYYIYESAVNYCSKQAIVHTYLLIANGTIKDFSVSQWAIKTASAFANKIMQLALEE